MYYNMFIYIMWCGMADDMMKKEVKATMLLLVEYAYLMNRSMMDVCFWNCSRYTHYKKA